MTNSKYSTITNYDGFIVKRDAVAFIAKSDSLEYNDYSRSIMYTCANGRWGHSPIPFMVNSSISVNFAVGDVPFKIFSLGEMSGSIEIYWPMGRKIEYEYLPGATLERGLLHLQQIREISGKILVVGITSQIFMRDDSGWHIFNQGIEPPELKAADSKNGLTYQELRNWQKEVIALNSVDGVSIDNAYAAGDDGNIIYRSNGVWKKLPKITNANLRRIRAVDSNNVYIVGDNGVLLQGNVNDGFSLVHTGVNDNFWGVEWFNGKLYIGGANTGVYVYNGNSVNRVSGLNLTECHTLHSRDGQLLVVGNKDAYLTEDGIRWRLLRNPNNE